MGSDKQGGKGGNYVGGFLQMFDWNAKSRKKLFSGKSDVPEQSKQKKTRDGNFPKTRLHMLDADENAGGSTVKGSSDQSCSSSVVDEDFCGTKAPGVVARLMGLDSLPKSSMSETYSTPLFSSHDSYYQTKNLDYYQDQSTQFSSLQDVPRIDMQPKYQKVIHRPIEKFQTEILPPKSAKSIPSTHHKLLSPIKSASFIPAKDAAQIMEAAARIIDPGPRERRKTKQPSVGSSSVPLRVRDLKQKVEAAQKPLKIFEGSQRKAESRAAKNIRGQSMNKSWNGSDSEESLVDVKNKSKSISLALQAKANVQKREGLNANSSRNRTIPKEPCELSPNHVFKSQSTTQRSVIKKPSLQNGSSVLRQNSQKQNCIVDRGKLPSNSNSKGGKTFSKESSTARQHSSSKLSGSSKVNSRKLSSEVRDDKREVSSSSTERVASKKRSADGNYHSGKNQMDKNGKAIQSRDIMDRQSSCNQDSGMTGIDVVSFTFTSPMTRLEGSGRPAEAGETCKIGYQSKRSLLNSDGTCPSRYSYLGHNVKGGDALNILLEQKLQELARKVEFSQQKSGTHSHDAVPDLEATMCLTMAEGNKVRDGMHMDYQGVLEEMSSHDSNISQARKMIGCHNPSPVSVLEHSPFAESCNSSDTTETNSSSGTGSKQFSSVQAQEVVDSYSFFGIEGDAELSDSASSNLPKSELEYVKEMLCNIELMFKDYALGIGHEIIKPPRLYNQDVHIIDQRLMFDCVGECLDLRCRQYVSGGYRSWAKGESLVRRKDRLAEEVYKEISGWSSDIEESMIDELVDKDMSNQYGRWLDFDTEAFEVGIQIESRILNSLIDEVVADMLVH
ncbi:hypothetical protein ACS0TY_022551 [Phlomoides rotata]